MRVYIYIYIHVNVCVHIHMYAHIYTCEICIGVYNVCVCMKHTAGGLHSSLLAFGLVQFQRFPNKCERLH